jgi:glycerol kinase
VLNAATRGHALEVMQSGELDVLVVGGGITGVGAALDAATLAGLAAGVWDGPDALPEIPLDLVAEPALAPSERARERDRWAAARELVAQWR